MLTLIISIIEPRSLYFGYIKSSSYAFLVLWNVLIFRYVTERLRWVCRTDLNRVQAILRIPLQLIISGFYSESMVTLVSLPQSELSIYFKGRLRVVFICLLSVLRMGTSSYFTMIKQLLDCRSLSYRNYNFGSRSPTTLINFPELHGWLLSKTWQLPITFIFNNDTSFATYNWLCVLLCRSWLRQVCSTVFLT